MEQKNKRNRRLLLFFVLFLAAVTAFVIFVPIRSVDYNTERDKIGRIQIMWTEPGAGYKTADLSLDGISSFCGEIEKVKGIRIATMKTHKDSDTPVTFFVYGDDGRIKSWIICYDRFIEVYPNGFEEPPHYVYWLAKDPMKEFGSRIIEQIKETDESI